MSSGSWTERQGAQEAREGAFIEEVKSDIRPALLDELRSLYERFDEYPTAARLKALEVKNRAQWGKGSSLVVEYGPARLHAYAGCDLAIPRTSHFAEEGVEVVTYEPLFENVLNNGNKTHEVIPGDVVAFGRSVRASPIREFIFCNGSYGPSHALYWDDLPAYGELPIAYRVALVCQYVAENVVATPSEITAFVLGATDNVGGHGYLVSQQLDTTGCNVGWVVRLGYLRPPQKLGEHIASRLTNLVADSERGCATPGQFEEKHRAAEPRAELAYTYIHQLEEGGVRIGRGRDKSWNEVAAELVEKYGDKVRRYTSDNLRDGYIAYAKRHGWR